jgi:NAD(P)-dependent dehydrogenase (short-subunit alcohol dehydrogenase family)
MRWDDLEGAEGKFDGMAAYNQSKLANILFTKALARRLAGKGVSVNALHPGVVATELTRDYPRVVMTVFKMFLMSPEKGAECSLYLATSPEVAGTSGEYFEKSTPTPASRDACDIDQQERLWRITERIIQDATKRNAA